MTLHSEYTRLLTFPDVHSDMSGKAALDEIVAYVTRAQPEDLVDVYSAYCIRNLGRRSQKSFYREHIVPDTRTFFIVYSAYCIRNLGRRSQKSVPWPTYCMRY